MQAQSGNPRRSGPWASAVALLGGLAGLVFGRLVGSWLPESPPWVGPGIVVGSLALLLVGTFLLPLFRRHRAPRGRAR
ncbi:hypothetical protein Psesu_0257 [Pseudoxanthomonas suwonensis 11-1]|uniref:Uncharacterized protein n=1 Tax=Pseudoxanthomonas suwonensis (strain 11-1) TaxID=743721 RepID=E6WPE6_PSEUU|nr:hypothetical protein Psesu_0257 [Pseudoxanthomonas suwonensis 11-1]